MRIFQRILYLAKLLKYKDMSASSDLLHLYKTKHMNNAAWLLCDITTKLKQLDANTIGCYSAVHLLAK